MNNIYNHVNLTLPWLPVTFTIQNTNRRLSTQINGKSKKAQQKREKTKQKRWGKKFEDKRNWKEYNEKLVKLGELNLSLEFLDNWDTELNKMNEDKKGAPFSYPEQFVLFMAFVYSIFHIICLV